MASIGGGNCESVSHAPVTLDYGFDEKRSGTPKPGEPTMLLKKCTTSDLTLQQPGLVVASDGHVCVLSPECLFPDLDRTLVEWLGFSALTLERA